MGEPVGAEAQNGESLDRWGPTAIMSYLSMIVFAATIYGVFYCIVEKIEISGLMGTLIGSVLTATFQNSAGAMNFWTGGNVGSKAANRALQTLASSPNTSVIAPAAATQIVNPNALDSPARPDLDIPEPPRE